MNRILCDRLDRLGRVEVPLVRPRRGGTRIGRLRRGVSVLVQGVERAELGG